MKTESLTAFANALLAAPPAVPTSPLAAKVDRLGFIRAELDRLALEAETIREELEAAGLARIEGAFYSAGFTRCEGAEKTDWKTIATRLKASPQLIRAHTKQGAGYTRLLLTAKIVKH